jgi:hypothetical protein
MRNRMVLVPLALLATLVAGCATDGTPAAYHVPPDCMRDVRPSAAETGGMPSQPVLSGDCMHRIESSGD